MILYLLSPFFILLCAAFNNVNKGYKKVLIFQVCVLFFMVAGFRGTVGSDTYSYANLFRSYLVGEYGIFDGKLEPFFIFLFWVVSKLTESAFGFFLLVSMVQSILVFYIANKLRSPFFFLFFYSIVFYLQLHMNIIRAGTAVLFFAASIVCDNRRRSLLLMIFSVLTHFTALALVPVWLSKFRVKLVALTFIILFFLLFSFGVFGSYIYAKVVNYLVIYNESRGMGVVGNLLFLAPPLVLIIFMSVFKIKSSELWVSSFLILVFAFGRNYFDIFYRLHSLSLLGFMVVLSRDYWLFSWLNIRYAAGYGLLFMVSCLLSVYGVVNEPKLVADSFGVDHIANRYTWLPYETYFNDSY